MSSELYKKIQVVPRGKHTATGFKTIRLILGKKIKSLFWGKYKQYMPIPVAVRSKAWVFGRFLAGIAGSNPTGGMDVCLL
jgi:hypothetical protein